MRKIVIGAIAATLLIAACGGSSKNNSTGSGGSTGGGSDEFSQLTAKAKTADIKITYTSTDGKSQTYEQDGTGKTAFTTGDSTIIYDGTNSYSCSGTGADASCTQLPGSAAASAGAFVNALLPLYTGLKSSVYGGHTSSDTIAGRDAKCVTFKESDYAGLAGLAGGSGYDASASATVCADSQTGFLLKFVATGNNKTTDYFVATAVDKSSASDFTPPVTPSTIPGSGSTDTTAAGSSDTTAYTLPGGVTLPNGYTIPTTPTT